ncbi:MAG: hypothetical protein ACRD51_01945 [Candidatus Acidiferrum sp.]
MASSDSEAIKSFSYLLGINGLLAYPHEMYLAVCITRGNNPRHQEYIVASVVRKAAECLLVEKQDASVDVSDCRQ